MPSIYADKHDIFMFTAPARSNEEKIQKLIEKGVPYGVNDRGDILVLRSSLEEVIHNKKATRTSRRHNFGALSNEKRTLSNNTGHRI